jgi:L-lactate dehydrogenase complex protein LldF
VKIDLHEQLLTWRRDLAGAGHLALSKRLAMKLAGAVLRRPWLYRLAGGLTRFVLRWSPRFLVYGPWNPWGRQRDLPPAPAKSFRARFKERAR